VLGGCVLKKEVTTHAAYACMLSLERKGLEISQSPLPF